MPYHYNGPKVFDSHFSLLPIYTNEVKLLLWERDNGPHSLGITLKQSINDNETKKLAVKVSFFSRAIYLQGIHRKYFTYMQDAHFAGSEELTPNRGRKIPG